MNKMLSLILLSIVLISANLPYINTVIIDTSNDGKHITEISFLFLLILSAYIIQNTL